MKRRTLLQAAPALLGAPGLLLAQTGFPAKPIRSLGFIKKEMFSKRL